MRTIGMLVATMAILTLFGCRSTAHLKPVQNFDAERYMDKWHEIARLPHSFEEGLEQVTAEYRILDSGKVEVVNRGYDTEAEKWKEARATAKFTQSPDIGELRVTFFWPFSGLYKVIRLDPDYRYAVVTSSTYDYLWILAREPVLPEETTRELVNWAGSLGFETYKLVYPAPAAE